MIRKRHIQVAVLSSETTTPGKNYTFNTVRALLSVLICEHSYCLDKLLLTHHLVIIKQHLAIFLL